METTYYTLTAREIIVSGDGISAAVGAPARQLVCVRRPASQEEQAQDNVIDLAAWKAAREEETRLEEEWYAGVDEALAEPAPIPPRPRRNHKKRVIIFLRFVQFSPFVHSFFIQIFKSFSCLFHFNLLY